MGNKSTSAQNPFGAIAIQTEQQVYFPGETVNGFIHLQLKNKVQGNLLYLKVKGKESTKWTTDHPDSDIDRNEMVQRSHFGHSSFLNYKIPVHCWNEPYVLAGEYSVPFSLVLPQNIPGSFNETTLDHSGIIGYKFKAELHAPNGEVLIKGSSPFWIKEPVHNQVTPVVGASTFPIITCCCCLQGSVSLNCKFEKDVYSHGETANLVCEIDNSQGKVAVQKLKFLLVYTIILSNNSDSNRYSGTLSELITPGVGAGKTAIGEGHRIITLPIFAKQNQKGEFQASTHGNLVRCLYSLQVHCQIDGCICSGDPMLEVPIIIYAPIPEFEQIQPPANWAPQQIPLVTVSLNQQYQYKSKKDGTINDNCRSDTHVLPSSALNSSPLVPTGMPIHQMVQVGVLPQNLPAPSHQIHCPYAPPKV